ncbi:hypothetical protein [Aquabacter cavernae]|uniref:hypothetical protein n=1 Tax=Aquabacter cavernae TaxID=2496029 RepID=UPI000F8C81B6|nr:hypothetical protein [Aquabacter cavernae]
MRRILAFLFLCSALGALAPWALPAAREGMTLVRGREDPSLLAELALSGLTPQAMAGRIDAALAADDPELAASALQWADAHAIPVAPDLRARVAQANTDTAQALRAARKFGAGFLTGTPDDLAGLAGAAAGDLTVWGDLRDATREGWNYARGEPTDTLILGLSAAGLALTAGTYATLGASAPARAGLTLVKVARRTGRLTASLGTDLTRLARESVDFAALRKGAGALDAGALKAAIRPAGAAKLTRVLDDLGTVQAKAGTRAALDGLAVAETTGDVTRLARLAEKSGGQTLFILKSVGRGALVITGALLSFLWWAVGALVWLVMLVSGLNGLCVSAARLCWRRLPSRAQRQ